METFIFLDLLRPFVTTSLGKLGERLTKKMAKSDIGRVCRQKIDVTRPRFFLFLFYIKFIFSFSVFQEALTILRLATIKTHPRHIIPPHMVY